MSKQEILDAINATIVPNGQKGITAESLANILTEMVNAAGEGGSGGSGGSAGNEVIRLSNYGITEDGIVLSTTEDDAAHNATVYAKYAASVANGTSMSLVIDVSKSLGPVMQFGESDFLTVTPFTTVYSETDPMLAFGGICFGMEMEVIVTADGNAQCLIPTTE